MAQRFSRIQRLLAVGRFGLPFSFGRAETQIVRLRRQNLRERFRGRPWHEQSALMVFCTLSYPVLTLGDVRRTLALLRRSSPDAGWSAGIRMSWLALTKNVPPVSYLFYGFEDPERRARWAEYLYWTDRDAVKLLNRLRGADPKDVQNKARFAAICVEHGLAHVPVLDAETMEGGSELWLKPVDLQAGVGAQFWRRDAGGYVSGDGKRLPRGEFLAYVDANLSSQTCVIQPRMRNHPEIEAVTNGWLATLRIVVALRRDGRTVLLGNGLGLPKGGSRTSGDGVVCAARWEDGEIFHVMDPARAGKAAAEDFCHPDTGVRLLGRKIPFWHESLELVQRAHREAFPGFATLGWDVALTPDGPLLLETNSGWGDMHLQTVFGPLGQTELTEMIAEELPDEAGWSGWNRERCV